MDFQNFNTWPNEAKQQYLNEARTKMRSQIIGRLKAENAKDLSDAELERCLGDCVLYSVVLANAILFRGEGFITVNDLID